MKLIDILSICVGKTCPTGMSLIYGKCVGVVSNTESDDGDHSNCNWNSDSNNYRLAVFGNIKVIFLKLYCKHSYIVSIIFAICFDTPINFAIFFDLG